MNKKLDETDEINENLFYSDIDNLYISASSLKLLMDSPKKYYDHYVLNKKEQKTGKHFDEGSLVHCIVLEPDTLYDKFYVMGITTPSETIKECINYIFKNANEDLSSDLNEHKDLIIDYLKEINLYQAYTSDKKKPFLTGDEKRINKIVNDDTVFYFKKLVDSVDKKIVDSATFDKCLAKANAILENPDALNLLRVSNNTDVIRYELELEEKSSEFKYGIKGILDVVKVDRQHKIIYVSDIKTTNGNLKEFSKSFEKYEYWLQAAVYKKLCSFLARGQGFDFKIIFNFIVVDCNNNVYCFEVLQESMKIYEDDLLKLVNEKFHYHIKNKDFTIPYEFANKLVYL